jgi:hypothetical protein
MAGRETVSYQRGVAEKVQKNFFLNPPEGYSEERKISIGRPRQIEKDQS